MSRYQGRRTYRAVEHEKWMNLWKGFYLPAEVPVYSSRAKQFLDNAVLSPDRKCITPPIIKVTTNDFRRIVENIGLDWREVCLGIIDDKEFEKELLDE